MSPPCLFDSPSWIDGKDLLPEEYQIAYFQAGAVAVGMMLLSLVESRREHQVGMMVVECIPQTQHQ